MAYTFPFPLIPLSGAMTVSPANYVPAGGTNYTGLQARFFHTTILDANTNALIEQGSLNGYVNLEFTETVTDRKLLPGDFILVQFGPQNKLSIMQVNYTNVGGQENYQLVVVTLT